MIDLMFRHRSGGSGTALSRVEAIATSATETLDNARSLVRELIARHDAPILIHCIGGLGRTGVIAGCLLRALDVPPDETLRRLVAARGKRCPETSEQRRFVTDFSLNS